MQDGKFKNVGMLVLQTIQTILSDRSPSWAFQYKHAVWNLPSDAHVLHAYTQAPSHTHTHTDIPVGGGGSASYYQLIFAVFFLLQRVLPYGSLSATAFNLLLASAVKTSYLNCWLERGSIGRHEGEHHTVHTLHCMYNTCLIVPAVSHTRHEFAQTATSPASV